MNKLTTFLAVPAVAAGLLLWGPILAEGKQGKTTESGSKRKSSQSGNASNQAGAAAGNATQGETVYKQKCASCHGADLAGTTAMGKRFNLKSLKSPEVQNMTDSQLFDVIAKGKGKMPAYESSLGHEKIHDIIAYMRQAGKGK